MLAHGSDRLRVSGEKAILHSRLPKGWTPRTPKTLTHSEYPGTAVLWDGEYYEVVLADALPAGGVRYVLEPWREEHAMRFVVGYDDATEAALLEDHRHAERQRRGGVLARIGAIFVGLLPQPVQEHLGQELGISPARMTLASCVPAVALFGGCIWLTVDAKLRMQPSPVPFWLFLFAALFLFEAGVRFFVAMSQNRGFGSVIGAAIYIAYWLLSPKRSQLVSPFAAPGERLFTLPPSDEVALRDSLESRGILLTFLSPAEQQRLVERYGFDYRRHAVPIAWAFLVCALLGVVTMLWKLAGGGGTLATFVSLAAASAVAIEQIRRLAALRTRPAGSVFAAVVRPFVRDLLERG